jgi:hypothetical protein
MQSVTIHTQNAPNWPQNISIFSIGGPPKFTQIGIFGLKINNLAILLLTAGWKTFLLNRQKCFV